MAIHSLWVSEELKYKYRMKNKLTLKSLKLELERLKSLKETVSKKDIGHDIKNSYINRLYSKSGALWLYILTGVLGYAHKLPYIGRIISLLSLWYGRTTIWKILVRIRKIFIVFNAIIGVYIVFKGVGFSTDNLIGGFYGVGHTYLEMFYGMTKRLFYWFVDLFDHKIVPNVPGSGPKSPYNPFGSPGASGWYTKPMHNAPLSEKILDLTTNKDLFTNPFNISINTPTPWYRDSSTWYWIAGITCAIGLSILGYKLLMDPSILNELIGREPGSGKGGASGSGPSIVVDSPAESVAGSIKGKARDIGSGILNFPRVVFNKLNPFNYIVASETVKAQYETFLDFQNKPDTADLRLYPFTHNNPYDSWFSKYSKHIFGETLTQKLERAQDRMGYDRAYKQMTGDVIFSAPSTVFNTHGTNTPSTFGLGLRGSKTGIPGSGLLEALNNATVEHTQRKLASLPATPKTILGDWADHKPTRTPEGDAFMDRLLEKRRLDNAAPSTSTQGPPAYTPSNTQPITDIEPLDIFNRFSVLDEVLI
jgi:hypothetical protein